MTASLLRCAAALMTSLSLAASATAPAFACGHCREDKVAATYDYGVLTRAMRARHVVVFAEIRGPAPGAGAALRAFVERSIATTRGVDAGTVRVSLDPPAASFACDPARHDPARLLAPINRGLAAKRLGLAILEIDRGPRPVSVLPAAALSAARGGRAAP